MSTVLIAGGSGGIGSALAARLRERGDAVAILGRNGERLETVAAATGAYAVVGDVLDSAAFTAALDDAEARLGEIDGYVHAVGSVLLKPLHALSLEEWRTTFEINATSAFLALKVVMPRLMRRKRGSVVLFSTVATRMGLQNHEAIAAAKGAIDGLVTSAAMTYARYGVRVNAVAPGLTRTPLSRSLWENEAARAASEAMHPLGRIGEPDDIAAAVAYLLGDDAGWVTGHTIGVDGGLGTGTPPPRMVAGR